MWNQLVKFNTNITYVGGWCLAAVQDGYDSLHWYPTAKEQWNKSPDKHWDMPPEGIDVPVYFNIPTNAAGHVAVRLANGKVASASYAGKHKPMAIHDSIQDLINDYMAGGTVLEYLGWTESCANLKVVQFEEKEEMVTENQLAVLYRFYLGTGISDFGYKERLGKQTFDFVMKELSNSEQFKNIVKNARDNGVVPVRNLTEGIRKVFNQ